jgi:hypothetical protein
MLLRSHVNKGRTERKAATTYKLRILRARLPRRPRLRHWDTFWLQVLTGRTKDIYKIEPLMTAQEMSRNRRYGRRDPEGAIRKQRGMVRVGMKEKRREVAVIDELRAGCLWRPRELKRWTTVRRAFPKPTLKRL